MKYKLIDCQMTGLKEDEVYPSRAAARDSLREYHSADVNGARRMSLNMLLEIGCWELVKIKEVKNARNKSL